MNRADEQFLRKLHIGGPTPEEIEARLRTEYEARIVAMLERSRAESIAAARGILQALLCSLLVWMALWLSR
jgi:hypothetical protein